jgi:hypothetical protein
MTTAAQDRITSGAQRLHSEAPVGAKRGGSLVYARRAPGVRAHHG